MGRELGNETYIDVLLESSALFPPNSTLVGNDDFYTNLVRKVGALKFPRISRQDRVGKNKAIQYFIHFFLLHVQCCIRGSASNFQVLTRKGCDARALRNIFKKTKARIFCAVFRCTNDFQCCLIKKNTETQVYF